VTNSLPIAELLGGNLPTIGDIPVSISDSNYYDESTIPIGEVLTKQPLNTKY